MNTWHKLFEQKLQEVLNKDNKHYLFATISPTSQGNCARELIAEEYYAQLQEIEKLAAKVAITERDYSFMKDLALAYEKALETKTTKPLSDEEIDESFDRTASHMANEYVSHYEPAAWINHIKQTGGDFYELNVSGRGEPLYRHPPQTKPLSDEEIIELTKDSTIFEYREFDDDMVRFARAIEERHGIK